MRLTRREILDYLRAPSSDALMARADAVRKEYCGETVYIRGLIEISNHCARNCLYCGLRRDHTALPRYRMTREEILGAVSSIVAQGIKTIVLQSGDDLGFTQKDICHVVESIKSSHGDVAVTLSLGERTDDDYRAFKGSGADRYLMRHEVANPVLYEKLHPGQSLSVRIRNLHFLRGIGFQVGAGFMVGLPGQTDDDLASDILFLEDFLPDMAGIGPFIPQANTPLAGEAQGREDATLRALALARIATRFAHLPATTALATVDKQDGLSAGLKAGCNVIMTNNTPDHHRQHYRIYDKKTRVDLTRAMDACRKAVRHLSGDRGDSIRACHQSAMSQSFEQTFI
ncbi:MAG: [FeFe] hydrogenase H-cluster radical SAM maturase HydE [Lentisphaerota bacterium]